MKLDIMGRDRVLDFTPKSLIIAGFTGKDRASAEKHIMELAEIGVPVPDKIPSFYVLDPGMVSTFDSITVQSRESSGEVEPVLINVDGELFVGAGSDHTARDVEKKSIADSKSSCRKPIASTVVEYKSIKRNWSSVELSSWVVDGEKKIQYQRGMVSEIMDIPDILTELKSSVDADLENSVIFLGTLPLLTGKFVYGSEFGFEMKDGESSLSISHSYTIRVEED